MVQLSPPDEQPSAPPPPHVRLCVGVTGHRSINSTFAGNQSVIAGVLENLFTLIDNAVARAPRSIEGLCFARSRLHSMLADGTDQMAVEIAKKRGWDIVAPLPYSLPYLAMIAVEPQTSDEVSDALAYARARIEGDEQATAGLSAAMKLVIDPLIDAALQATRFELAERDDRAADLLTLAADGDREALASFAAEASYRYALASRIIVEQSDLLIAVWDGTSRTQFGGTGHTISVALEAGVPVVLIPANAPRNWCVVHAPEALSSVHGLERSADEHDQLSDVVARIVSPNANAEDHGLAAFLKESWREGSTRLWNGYRRIEALFGEVEGRSPFRSLTMRYERPSETARGSWGTLFENARLLPGVSAEFLSRLDNSIAQRFAWADGLSTHLSDAYRGGMVLNFLLSAFAIIIGLAYLPFASSQDKWIFASLELMTLGVILFVTAMGRRLRWHERWFEGRRVAEYLRHGPILLLLGVARSAGRWPRGVKTSWPEWYARQALREAGLPCLTSTQSYLRQALISVLRPHVVAQRDYHFEKARRLSAVHHNLDRMSSRLFQLALIVVAAYVGLKGLALVPGTPEILGNKSSSYFTFFGVILPMLGATIAGIRYFGDFERFAGISEVAAEKLEGAAKRIDQLLAGSDQDIDYESVSRIAHAVDDCVVAEIESWQSVFRGKEITIPV